MKLPKILSQTLKRFTPNFNNCIPAFLRKRPKPSDLSAENDSLISNSNNSNSTQPDQIFEKSAENFPAKPILSPLRDPNLNIQQALNEVDKIDTNLSQSQMTRRPISGAGVFSNTSSQGQEAEVSSAMKTPGDNVPRQVRRVRAIRTRGENTYQIQPSGINRQRTELTHQIIPSQLIMKDQQNIYTTITDPLKDAVDYSDSDSDYENDGIISESIMNGFTQLARQASNINNAFSKAFNDIINPTNLSTNSVNPTQSTFSSPTAPRIPQPSEAESETFAPNNAIDNNRLRAFKASQDSMRILESIRAMKPKVPVKTEIIKNQQIRNAEPETTRNSPGKLDPKILAIFGGGLTSNLSVSRPATPVQKPREEIQPEASPISEPQPSLPVVQLTQIPNTPAEDPNFPNELKARIFDYINQAADLGYRNIPDIEKPIYFDCAMKMIEMKNKTIKISYDNNWKKTAVSLTNLNSSNIVITDLEKIKLFNLMNSSIKLITKDDGDRISKFNFIVKAIKLKKDSIKKGLDKLIEEKKMVSNHVGVFVR